MSIAGNPANPAILVVRLGAMGDILHALPAVAALKQGLPHSHLTWVVEPKWAPLLAGNPFVDRVVTLDRKSLAGLRAAWLAVRAREYDLAVDFQGLMKSALVTWVAQPGRVFGFDAGQVRERPAALFYTRRLLSGSTHVVERNLDLARAAGAASAAPQFPLPPGEAEGQLPAGDFVLASPLAGWVSKQWPLEHYRALAERLLDELGLPLVLNGAPGAPFQAMDPALAHYCGLPGLIHATRRAVAVVGVDSGPLHLAAALGKPGVAIFGPTDPERNGPHGGSPRALRAPGAATTYRRGTTIAESMRMISPDEVFQALRCQLP